MARNQNLIVNLLLVVISAFILYSAFQIDLKGSAFISSPRVLPVLLSSVMLLLSLVNVFAEWNKGARIEIDNVLFFLGFLVLVILYVGLMRFINFHVLTFLFLFGSFLYFRTGSVVRNFLVAAMVTVSSYLIFEKVFRIIFPG